MKVLQITDAFGPYGGTERFIYEFSREMIKQGDHTIIAAGKLEDQSSWGKALIDTICIDKQDGRWMDFVEQYAPELVVWHSTPKTAAIIRKLSERYPVASFVHGAVCPSGGRLFRDKDEICMRTGGLGCLPRWYFRKCGTSLSPLHAVEALRDHIETVAALQVSRKVYAVSHAVKKILVNEGVPQEKICVFDNSLGLLHSDSPLISPQSTQPLNLLFVGRLVYEKGVQYLLEALQLLKLSGKQTECTIVGDGWYRNKLERMAEEKGIVDNVRFAGQVPGQEILEWYKRSDLIVVPSIWPEPAGLIVPEARSTGKPVIVFDSGGLPEWGEEMSGIYVVEHANSRKLADTIASFIVSDKEQQAHTVQPQVPAAAASPRMHPLKDILSYFH